jgi:tagatose-6-phosphate ketose/aldose isomerase
MHNLLSQISQYNKDQKTTFTSEEITRQPNTWKAVWKKLHDETSDLKKFLEPIFSLSDLNIVLTGAGSSAFIGEVVSSTWQKNTGHTTQAIPTTDLVTHFNDYILTEAPLLLISFARSGNSPESTAAINQANKFAENVFHLIITCNPDGNLAQMKENDNTFVFLLPPEAEDQSLAMTNSFTSMGLSATLIAMILKTEQSLIEQGMNILTEYGNTLLQEYSKTLHEVSQQDFDRVVFLGSGPLLGIARESHLKVQELTNGEVVGKFDSFLGFRHGPKAIINENTLLVYLLSNDDQTSRYEHDLINQIAKHDINLTTLSISESKSPLDGVEYQLNIGQAKELDEALWAILCTLPGQIIGYFKSILLGYNPDNPSPDGTISRVVEGVKIYDDSAKAISK